LQDRGRSPRSPGDRPGKPARGGRTRGGSEAWFSPCHSCADVRKEPLAPDQRSHRPCHPALHAFLQAARESLMNLVEILRDHVRTRGDAAAIIDRHRGNDRITTFAELDRASAQAATLLWQAGLRPGDAVLVFHPMSAELYVALLGLFRLGLIAMFL